MIKKLWRNEVGDFQRKGSEVMKKIVYALLLSVSLVLLTACGNGKDTPGKEEKPKDKQTETQKEPQDVSEKEPEDESGDEPDGEIQDEPEGEKMSKDNPDLDKDYKGDIPCPLPPKDSSYRIGAENDDCVNLLLYIENIDDANFKFYFTKAFLQADQKTIEEEVIFIEHIAHYNGEGFYEYIGENYHLYFKYYELGNVVGDHQVEVYGQEGIYSTKEYAKHVQYNGMNGNILIMGAPFAG